VPLPFATCVIADKSTSFPACAVFLNNPEKRKWHLSFKDGGKGGPNREDPYYCAVELKSAYRGTHYTITTSPDLPGRDPKLWAIQGSNTGRDGESLTRPSIWCGLTWRTKGRGWKAIRGADCRTPQGPAQTPPSRWFTLPLAGQGTCKTLPSQDHQVCRGRCSNDCGCSLACHMP
jgi:hypothetical protein